MTDLSRMLVAGELQDESTVTVGVGPQGLTYSITKNPGSHEPRFNMHQDVTKRLRLDTLGEPRGSEMSDGMEE